MEKTKEVTCKSRTKALFSECCFSSNVLILFFYKSTKLQRKENKCSESKSSSSGLINNNIKLAPLHSADLPPVCSQE